MLRALKLAGTRISELLDRLPQVLALKSGEISLTLCLEQARLRAARNMPPTIIMLRLFVQRQRTSMSAYFTNSLTPPSGLGLLASPRGENHLGRAARGSVGPRKM